MKATITLFSNLYGEETFKYDSIKEARAGFSRLLKSCFDYFEKDSVDRELTLEGSNGLTYRSAQISKVYVKKTTLRKRKA